MKNPYTYPHRSRKARIEYLSAHESYHPMNSWNGGFVLSWNVKIYNGDYSGKNAGKPCDYVANPTFDDAWEKEVENDEYFFSRICEDVFGSCCGDYSTYPGNDGGNYNFALNGRSGGHLVLTECEIVPQPRRWKLFPMIWESRGDYEEWLTGLSTETLERFYKAIRCMDTDFSCERVRAEFNYQVAFRRTQWEEEQQQILENEARNIEASRPDMYAV